MKSQLFLIPTTLGGDEVSMVIPNDVIEIVKNLRIFFVEEIKSARRFLRKVDRNFPIDDCAFYNIGKKNKKDYLQTLLTISENKNDFGVMSEAGCPGVADPGAMIASLSHDLNIYVTPLVGPSSILLAMMASGLNGNNFSFNGYLPIGEKKRMKKIKEFENNSKKNNQTQIFIETPYRNQKLFDDLIKVLNDQTFLCIAINVGSKNQKIKTMSAGHWKTNKIKLSKDPSIFIFHSGLTIF